MSDEREGSWRVIAPIAAGVVVLLGVGFLLLRGGDGDTVESGSVAPAATDRAPNTAASPISTPPTPDSAPAVTNPPLAETTSTTAAPAPEPTTPVPTTPRVTNRDLATTLVTTQALGTGWEPIAFEEGDICTSNEFDQFEIATAASSHQQNLDTGGVRQISHVVTAYTDAQAAANAFVAEINALDACNGTTVDLGGVQYRVDIIRDAFDDQEVTGFPCQDDNASLVAGFNNSEAFLPFFGQALIGFRCGANVYAVSLSSTVSLADLNDPQFFEIAAAANVQTALLPGS
ncbi:MAG: hypothetical protein AB8G26_18440 [Ilumatobacter sp.]